MGIELASSFDRKAGVPLDSLSKVATIAARDAIPALVRYVGMEVTVLDDGTGLQKKYWLKYGIDNADWSDDVGGGGSGSGVIQAADIAARDAIATDQRQEGLLVYVFSAGLEPKTFQLVGGISNAHWKEVATQDSMTVLKNKDIDGGTASNTSRITVSKGLKSDLFALDRKQGTILFATDELVLYYDNGTSLIPLGAQLSTDTMISHTFKANGNYQVGTGIDGIFVLPWSAKISNVILSNEIAGTSGTTDVDVKIKPQGSGSFTSIFSTTPKLASSAGSNAWV